MPSIEWNRCWEKNLLLFLDKNPKKEIFFGDRWGIPDEDSVLEKIRDNFIIPLVNENKTIVEIGPGGGRWTKYLLNCDKLYLVDISAKMFEYLKKRFNSRPNIKFCLTDGSTFPGVPKNSVDLVLSMATFVHLEIDLIEQYLRNMKIILKDQSDVVIEYPEMKKSEAAKNPGFAKNTAETMRKLVRNQGFSIISEDNDSISHTNIIHFGLR